MKILFVTPYITSKAHPAFLRNQTGFGYMVHDIAEYVGKHEQVDLFSAMTFTPDLDMDGFHVVGRSWWTWLKNIRWRNIRNGIQLIKRYPQTWKNHLRTLYIFASTGQIERMVKQYNVVHIHGCNELTDAVVTVCKRQGVKFLVTLHGLNSFGDVVKMSSVMKRHEKDFLLEAAKQAWPVTFISTGNKLMAENYVKKVLGKVNVNYNVIINGCDIIAHKKTVDIRSIYHIANDKFVFVFVGNISENKNQLQVARAWMLLPEEDKQKCRVLFVGNYKKSNEIVTFIREHQLQKELILCGKQPKEHVPQFYYAADATILTSISEGFGLSIIEGFVYGKPNVTFCDLPAVADLFDEDVMVLSKNRSDQALADAMIKIMHRKFNKEKIRQYAKDFSFEKMAANYSKLYRNLLK